MGTLIGYIIAYALGFVSGLIITYFVWRNNKKRINDLLATAKQIGVILK